LLDVNSNVAKQQIEQMYYRYLAVLEPLFEENIFTILNRQYTLAALTAEIGQYDIEYDIDKEGDEMVSLFDQRNIAAAAIFLKVILDALKRRGLDLEDLSPTQQATFTASFWLEMKSWSLKHAANHVTKVNATTKSVINRIINRGLEEGWTNQEIATKIKRIGAISNSHRAKKIARTETHTASNHSLIHSMLQYQHNSNTEWLKEWFATKDDRTRIPHRLADGEKKELNDFFIRTGEPMMYPGDPRGSAWNIVYCRCVTLFRRKK
jgi:hypothetical protein